MSVDSIAFDSILELCQNKYRRIVRGRLAEEQRSLTLMDLTKTVLTYNQQTLITDASADGVTEISPSLHHVQLPTVAAEGLIHNDSARRLLELTAQLDQVKPILSTIPDVDPILEAPMELLCRSTVLTARSNADSSELEG